MAPPLNPDTSFFSINGKLAEIFPSGTNADFSNFQTILNALAKIPEVILRVASGEYFLTDGLRANDFFGDFEGAGQGSTRISAGTLSAPMNLLDAVDRPLQNAAGISRMISFQESVSGGQAIGLKMSGITWSGAQVKSETGVGFGGASYRNIGVDAQVNIGSQADSLTIFDFQAQLNTTVPVPVGNTNILNVVVSENALQTGQIYVKDTDYSEDLATGEITRIPAGAITDGQTVFVNYNNAFNLKTVPLVNVEIEDCAFVGMNHRTEFGALHQNVHSGLVIQGGRPFIKAADANSVFSGFVFTSLPVYAPLFFDRATEPTMFLTGDVKVNNCSFERNNLGIVLQGFEGAASAGPYIFPSGVDRAKAVISQNSFDDCGNEHTGLPALLVNNLSACDLEIVKNKVTRTGPFTSLRVGQVHDARRLAGWVGRLSNWKFDENDITLNEPVNQGSGGSGRAIQVRGSTPASGTGVEASFSISKNIIRQSSARPFTKRAIQVQELNGGDIKDNTFIGGQNLEGENLAGTAIDIVSQTVAIAGNDFSGWQTNSVNVFLAAGAVGCKVDLAAADSVDDQGAGAPNIITGGIQAP